MVSFFWSSGSLVIACRDLIFRRACRNIMYSICAKENAGRTNSDNEQQNQQSTERATTLHKRLRNCDGILAPKQGFRQGR